MASYVRRSSGRWGCVIQRLHHADDVRLPSGEVLAGVRRGSLDHPLRGAGGEREHLVLEAVERLVGDAADEPRVGEPGSPVEWAVGVDPDPALRVRTGAVAERDRGGGAPRRREVVRAVAVVVGQQEQGDRNVIGQGAAPLAAEGLEGRSGDARRRPQAPLRRPVRQDLVERLARWLHDTTDHGPLLAHRARRRRRARFAGRDLRRWARREPARLRAGGRSRRRTGSARRRARAFRRRPWRRRVRPGRRCPPATGSSSWSRRPWSSEPTPVVGDGSEPDSGGTGRRSGRSSCPLRRRRCTPRGR